VTPTVLYDHSSGLQITEEVNMKDVEISVAAENDGNVEKAEAYAKELEDVSQLYIYVIFGIYTCFWNTNQS